MINHKNYDSHIGDYVTDAEESAERSNALEELIERDEKIDETHDD